MRLYTRCPACRTEMLAFPARPGVMSCNNEDCAWLDIDQTDAQINHRYMEIAMTGPDYIDRHGNRWAAND